MTYDNWDLSVNCVTEMTAITITERQWSHASKAIKSNVSQADMLSHCLSSLGFRQLLHLELIVFLTANDAQTVGVSRRHVTFPLNPYTYISEAVDCIDSGSVGDSGLYSKLRYSKCTVGLHIWTVHFRCTHGSGFIAVHLSDGCVPEVPPKHMSVSADVRFSSL